MNESKKIKTVAITGANGLIGRHLCDYFHNRGWQVNALVRDISQYPFSDKGIAVFRCNLPDIIDLKGIDGADVLIHCAYMTRFTNFEEAQKVNEEGTARLLEATRSAGIEQFIFISSRAARADAESYYGQSKFKLESIMDQSKDLIVRPGLVLAKDGGLFHRIVTQVKKLPILPVFGGGKQKLNTIHVEDLCKVFEWAMEQKICGLITAAEADGINMKDLLRVVMKQLGQRKLIISVPGKPALLFLQMLEALKIKLPVSSENLRGLLSIDDGDPYSPDSIAQSGIRIRTSYESIENLVSKTS